MPLQLISLIWRWLTRKTGNSPVSSGDSSADNSTKRGKLMATLIEEQQAAIKTLTQVLDRSFDVFNELLATDVKDKAALASKELEVQDLQKQLQVATKHSTDAIALLNGISTKWSGLLVKTHSVDPKSLPDLPTAVAKEKNQPPLQPGGIAQPGITGNPPRV